jgi:hypothetical protein
MVHGISIYREAMLMMNVIEKMSAKLILKLQVLESC